MRRALGSECAYELFGVFDADTCVESVETGTTGFVILKPQSAFGWIWMGILTGSLRCSIGTDRPVECHFEMHICSYDIPTSYC